MFIGYQNDRVMFVADSREELESLPFVVLDKIEETDKSYFLYRGEYVTEIPEKPIEEQIEELQQYLDDTDWYVVRFAETGVEVPVEVKEERQRTREKIDALRKLQKTLI